MTRIDTIMSDTQMKGWGPIAALARLVADLFGGDCSTYSTAGIGRVSRIWHRRPRKAGNRDAVLLAFLPSAAYISALRRNPAFRDDYRAVVVWIVDSFWDNLPLRRLDYDGIDLICIIRRDELDHYRRHLGQRVMALNWGADVLGAGSDNPNRPVDLLRVGRQPEAWDDDSRSAAVAQEFGLAFHGRPAEAPDPWQNQSRIMAAYASAKYLIAHSNLTSNDNHTHKVKEYITGRWTDALACGATVAGVQPKNDDSYRRLLWPGAVLDFDHIDLRHNMAAMAEAVAAWTPRQAQHNHLMALQNLDWRHSIKRIADAVSARSDALDNDLARIAERLDRAVLSV